MSVKELTAEIKTLRSRVSSLRDEVLDLRTQITVMGERVQVDMKNLSERVNLVHISTGNYTGPR